MIKRRDLRINKKLMVSFNDGGFDGLGLTHNISRDGICVVSKTRLPISREIGISIAVPGEILEVKGEIMWNHEIQEFDQSESDQLGIKIVNAPQEYLNYVEHEKSLRLKSNNSANRAEPVFVG